MRATISCWREQAYASRRKRHRIGQSPKSTERQRGVRQPDGLDGDKDRDFGGDQHAESFAVDSWDPLSSMSPSTCRCCCRRVKCARTSESCHADPDRSRGAARQVRDLKSALIPSRVSVPVDRMSTSREQLGTPRPGRAGGTQLARPTMRVVRSAPPCRSADGLTSPLLAVASSMTTAVLGSVGHVERVVNFISKR